jgi:5'-phosphate synthase pdxT subunit
LVTPRRGVAPLIGILALQGDVREHTAALESLGALCRSVLRPRDLEGLAGLVLPGGESTTLSMLLESSGLFDPIAAALGEGLPAFGTCAGLVLMARRVLDGRPDQRTFGTLDVTVRRNGYGRQRESFEAPVTLSGPAAGHDGAVGANADTVTVPAVFIRAPVVEETGPDVEVLGRLARRPGEPAVAVVCRQGPVLATAFHPELTVDRRLHRLFLEGVAASTEESGADGPASERVPGPRTTKN